jgi:hypothetical protein
MISLNPCKQRGISQWKRVFCHTGTDVAPVAIYSHLHSSMAENQFHVLMSKTTIVTRNAAPTTRTLPFSESNPTTFYSLDHADQPHKLRSRFSSSPTQKEEIDLVTRYAMSGPPKVPSDAVSQNAQNRPIFIRPVLPNFYPDIGFGLQKDQFLSGPGSGL